MDPLSTGVGSKLKPCTKFFSTAGCPFGESCHFLHHVPGGYNAVAQMMNLGPTVTPPSRSMGAPLPVPNGSASSAVEGRLCNKYSSAEGCKFGDKCHFAHGYLSGRVEQPPPGRATSFGVFATTTRISADASLAGFIIGKGGVHSIQICHQTGVKLSIKEHEPNPNLKNIELEGSFEQIAQASKTVEEQDGHLNRLPIQEATIRPSCVTILPKGLALLVKGAIVAHGAAELRKTAA
ncbi:hypothetical protein NC652_017170 [Populus alba x Populus x berolinensis]|nr:hypothetical protein NC652_017170 [Populus alba x Populus x berolinensis]